MIQKSAKKNGWKTFKKNIPFYLMGLPALIYIFINNYMPLYGIQIAFKNYRAVDGIIGSAFVGFKNFEYLFSSDAFRITRNTVLYSFSFLILDNLVAVFVAIFLNEIINTKAKKLYQSLILLPYLMSYVVVAYIAYVFLSDNGLLNTIRNAFGASSKISWYITPKYWPVILTVVHLWKGIGFNTIIYLSTLVGFGKEYYEAAELDGANHWKQITRITLPLLRPTIITLLTLGMGTIFRSDFGLFYQVTRNQGLLYPVTDTIDTYVFRAITQTSDLGMSSAAALYQSVVCFTMVMFFNAVVRRISREDALF